MTKADIYKVESDTVENILLPYLSNYSPEAVFIKVNNKEPFLKKIGGGGGVIAYNFGVITKFPLTEERVTCRFQYWSKNELLSATVDIPNVEENFEILEYIIYPKEIFGNVLKSAENWGHLKTLRYNGKPIVLNKN